MPSVTPRRDGAPAGNRTQTDCLPSSCASVITTRALVEQEGFELSSVLGTPGLQPGAGTSSGVCSMERSAGLEPAPQGLEGPLLPVTPRPLAGALRPRYVFERTRLSKTTRHLWPMAGSPGFEPGSSVLETEMLPLHHEPITPHRIPDPVKSWSCRTGRVGSG